MKKNIAVIALILLAILGWFSVRNSEPTLETAVPDTPAVLPTPTTATYQNNELGLTFTHPSTYTVQEQIPAQTAYGLLRTLIIIPTTDLALMPADSEGPPSIIIHIAQNDSDLSPSTWAETNNTLSNISLRIGQSATTTLAGNDAIRYMIDGLYRSDTTVVSVDTLMYVFSGSFMDEDSTIRRDYQTLLDSIRFMPTPE